MSDFNSLPYLQELMSLNDTTIRKAKALKYCSTIATESTVLGFGRLTWGFEYLPKYKGVGIGSSTVSCVFGEFYRSWNGRYETKSSRSTNDNVRVKNGIEILGAQPNATGHTYSSKCLITVKELKEACKANGIKAMGNKKALLSALLKL
jgi:hypothetical protein